MKAMKTTVLLSVILMACTAVVFSQQELEDTDIADAIENKYRFDHAVDVNRIDVTVIDGIAELTGMVNNLKAKERANRVGSWGLIPQLSSHTTVHTVRYTAVP
jgi:hypothetical protein